MTEALSLNELFKIADQIASKFKFIDPAIERDDLKIVARAGILKAVRKYNPERVPNGSLEGWLWFAVSRDLTNFLNKNHRYVKISNEDIPDKAVTHRSSVLESLDTTERMVADYALKLCDAGYKRTEIRRIIKKKFGKEVFYKIQRKLEGGE